MFSTQLDENIYQRNGKNYVILHIFSRSINSHKITRQWAFRKRENYVILHTFNRPTIHNNMKMYIQETVKTTSFYTFSVDLYSHKITRQWASRKRKNCVILHTFNRHLQHNNMKIYIQLTAKTTSFYILLSNRPTAQEHEGVYPGKGKTTSFCILSVGLLYSSKTTRN